MIFPLSQRTIEIESGLFLKALRNISLLSFNACSIFIFSVMFLAIVIVHFSFAISTTLVERRTTIGSPFLFCIFTSRPSTSPFSFKDLYISALSSGLEYNFNSSVFFPTASAAEYPDSTSKVLLTSTIFPSLNRFISTISGLNIKAL